MRYDDVIDFQPIESVIQLLDSEKESEARNLVETFQISDAMAKRLTDLIFPHLQYEDSTDNKGLLIVGNYGTGKSHLMSVIAALAENAAFADLLTHEGVKDKAPAVAGKFKVLRLEIPGSEMGLRKILTSKLATWLKSIDVDYEFPPADETVEDKTNFEDMMVAFQKTYPDHGVLVVVDEFLEYLNSQKDHDLILALSFLRQVGEVTNKLRFRFIAGVQEAIFESGRFAHVGDSLSRVKDRFQQVRIVKEDVQFVVSRRLLRKTSNQVEQVKQHLSGFTEFYGDMNEKLDIFANLFPIHPDYINTFEKIPIVEKRGVLQVISDAIRNLIEHEVPEDAPGILAADDCWKYLIDNPAFRAVEDVRNVMDCSGTVEAKLKTAFPKKTYKPLADRILNGLSVHRLTTNDIHSPIGMTPEELRDGLCLYHPMAKQMGVDPAEDLLGIVESTLREIHKTVNGQFISSNPDNRQYYLDLKKTDDYDALIQKRAESIDEDAMNRRFFDMMVQVLEQSDIPTHVTGSRIWEYQTIWHEKKSGRLGYLFFGTPNERPTAVPKREFYLYFVPPWDTPKFKDDHYPDEVFFRLVEKDEELESLIKLYAASLDLEATASGTKKQAYNAKAAGYARDLSKWLSANFLRIIKVTYQGQQKNMSQWLQGSGLGGQLSIRDTVNNTSSVCLASQFQNQGPEYPTFSTLMTYRATGHDGNALQAAKEALRGLTSKQRTKQAIAVLDALELLEGEKIDPRQSRYSKEVLKMLDQKGKGQVLNRQELFQSFDGESYFMIDKFRLEPVWAIVVFASLIYSGDLVMAVPGKKYDATSLGDLATASLDDLAGFKHLERPKEWNMAALRALFELVGMAPGNATEVSVGKEAPVEDLQKRILEKVEELVMLRQQIQGGIPFWGQRLFTDDEIEKSVTNLKECQEFLESLQAFNSPGKLKNFRFTESEIAEQEKKLTKIIELQELELQAKELADLAHYLSQAANNLPDDHPWCEKSRSLRAKLQADMRKAENRGNTAFQDKAAKDLLALKKEYVAIYLDLYQKARLTPSQEKAKNDLTKDYRLTQLQALAAIPTINVQQLSDFQKALDQLKSGKVITEKDLETEPQADFWPSMESTDQSASTRLKNLKDQLDQIHTSWSDRLLADLEDPVVQGHLDLLKKGQQATVKKYLNSKELPDEIDASFVGALQQALSGLSRIALNLEELKNTLFPDGAPATPDEVKARFNQYFDKLLSGEDPTKARIVVE